MSGNLDLQAALEGAIRQGDLNARALIETSLLVRDLQNAIRKALEVMDRGDYELARTVLKQASDENPWPRRKRGLE